MDPFEFDQRFAKLVRQIDSAALSRGASLYEAEQVRIVSIGRERIRGLVTERREGAFEVSLYADAGQGFRGSCSCPEVFNCCHAYALARAARDQVVGRSPAATKQTPKAPSSKAGADPKLEKLWKLAQRSGNLLYPKDLYELLGKRGAFGPLEREPLRDLKKELNARKPADAEAFGAILRGYLEYRKIEFNSDSLDRYQSARFGQDRPAAATTSGKWDLPPLRLKARFAFTPSKDRDWFSVTAKWEVPGFTADEVERLRTAKGGLVDLGEKGWRRLESNTDSEEENLLHILGLDPSRGNSQRLHLCQLEGLFAVEALESGELRSALQDFKKRTKQDPAPAPQVLKNVLRPYQLEGYRFLRRLSELSFGGVLADDMGLGKTLQTLAWLCWLQEEQKQPLKVLVVCPKSVCENWIQEPEKFRTGLKASRFGKEETSAEESQIVVANYAQLRLSAEVFLAEEWDAVILDEAQYIKNPSSQTSKVAHRLRARNRLALSGTPVENRLTDLWSILRFAMPRLLGPLPSFLANYDANNEEGQREALRRRLAPFFLRRLKREVANELPERIEKDVYCELEAEQAERYHQALDEARETLRLARKEGKPQAFNVLHSLLRLRQICCDIRLLDTDTEMMDIASAKMEALLDLVEPLAAEGHKVLVFSQFVRLLDIAEQTLEQRGISALKLTGKTQNRAELVKRFQSDGNETVFFLSLKAAGSGLTLTAASYVILLDPWWNPAVEAQAIDRAHRIGQTNQVIAYRILCKDTVEEKIRQIQSEKAELAASLFGEGSFSSAPDLELLDSLLA